MSNDLDEKTIQHESIQGVDAVLARMHECIGKPMGGHYAEYFDISKNTLKTWRARGEIPMKFLKEFALEHDCSLDYLLYGRVQVESINSRTRLVKQPDFDYMPKQPIPRVGMVVVKRYGVRGGAGFGVMNYEEPIVEYIEISEQFLTEQLNLGHTEIAIVGVKGGSMEPTLNHGDQVFVDLTRKIINTNDVYAILVEGEMLFKRVQFKTDGLIWLLSDNKQFEPESLTKEQAKSLNIVGRVLPCKFGKFNL